MRYFEDGGSVGDWDFEVDATADTDPSGHDTPISFEDAKGVQVYGADENPAAIDMELLQAFAAQQEQLASQLQQELQLPPQFAQAIAANMMGSGPLGQIQEQVKSADEPQGMIPSAAKGESDSLQKIANMPYEQTLRMASDPDPRTLFKEQSAIGKFVSGEWGKMGGLDWLKMLAPALGFGANYMGAQSANKDAQKAAAAQNANVQGALSNFKEQMGRSTKIPGRGYMATTANRNAINIG